MIWLAVFLTLTLLNLALGDWLGTLTPVVRTFVLATTAVPIVIHVFMRAADHHAPWELRVRSTTVDGRTSRRPDRTVAARYRLERQPGSSRGRRLRV